MQRSFRFGVATSDHQCEAYDGNDDIRDVWDRVRGLTQRGRATDFWNRYREDADLAKSLGCTAFRISLAWARLEPKPGEWSDVAFAHYREVLQYLRDAGMATVVTLQHNTWPLHVQAAGDGAGMLDAGYPARLAAYAGQVARRLGDLIDYYVTLNEPNQLVYGYIKGFWMRAYSMPPGLPPFATTEQQMDAVVRLIANLFRAHTQARQAIRQIQPLAKVGANPMILGLPQWLQRWVDRNATSLKSPAQARRQAIRISQHHILESGSVDVSIAQVTMTEARTEHVLFSEPYYVAHLAALHATQLQFPPDLETWKVRVGVTQRAAPAMQVAGLFCAAAIEDYPTLDAAIAALRHGDVDIVADDNVILKQYAGEGWSLTPLPGHDQRFAVVMALGSRALLNAVDLALRDFKKSHPELPRVWNRKTIADVGRSDADSADSDRVRVPDLDRSLAAIRKRGILRVGVHPGVEGLCIADGKGSYSGLEPEIARHIAAFILGARDAGVRFVPLSGEKRLSATQSLLRLLDGFRKTIALFTTLIGTNWWNLGMAGRLPQFLCPAECVGALDYVGIDYYWGVPSFWPRQLQRLAAASEFRYANAPVWPNVLDQILLGAQADFPGKPIVIVENGCVESADGFTRAKYLTAHIEQVQRAFEHGVPIEAYLCWSITTNREWGLPLDANSDFGLYHIDLDNDPNLKRVPTEASARYAEIIAQTDKGVSS